MFLKELIKQTFQLKNITKLPDFIRMFYDYVETNIPLNVMLKAVSAANKIDIANMRTETIPGVAKDLYPNGKKVSYWIYDIKETEKLIQDMFGDYLK